MKPFEIILTVYCFILIIGSFILAHIKIDHLKLDLNKLDSIVAQIEARHALEANFEPLGAIYITAYNSLEAQTDDTPTIMASGKEVYVGAVANNCLPFGTKITLLGKEYIVEDRMNKRYGCEWFDIYMESYEEAINFGVKKL